MTTTPLPALKLGALAVDPAVVLAPMAGITNPAFRTLCREFGAGLYVCEMITTRALVERNEKTLQMVRATPDEQDAFSVQLYGVDPATVGRAVEMLVDEEVAGTRPGAHRPELRLPGAQGDPQGRGIGAAVAAGALPRHRPGRGARRRRTCRSP